MISIVPIKSVTGYYGTYSTTLTGVDKKIK